MSQFEVRARLKIRDGQLEGFKRQAAEIMRQAREKDTGTLAYDWFVSQDGTECEVREAYADALIDHAFHVREAREKLYAEFADDHMVLQRPVASAPRVDGQVRGAVHLVHPAPVAGARERPLSALRPVGTV
jgi:quinol monooxygenase YgiN